MAWLAQSNGIEEAIHHVKELRPESAPNIEVVRIADEYYGMNYELFGAVLSDTEFSERRDKAHLRREQQLEEFLRESPEKAAGFDIRHDP